MAAAAAVNGAVKVGVPVTHTAAYLDSKPVKETRALVSELCRQFYNLGWVSGTGGSITIKVHDDSIPKPQQLILMSPSGVQKERMEPEDMYVLSGNGTILFSPSPKPYPHKPPKCSDCAPLFMKAYEMRDAGAVIHSHGMESCLVTMINPMSKEFRITHMEMIKGIKGHGYYDELVVPIIENTAYENELTDSLAKAIEAYPKTTAVLVRNHGIYVWGDSWISAKTQAECYHYLFDAAIKLYQLGLDWSSPNHWSDSEIQRSFRKQWECKYVYKGTDCRLRLRFWSIPIIKIRCGSEEHFVALCLTSKGLLLPYHLFLRFSFHMLVIMLGSICLQHMILQKLKMTLNCCALKLKMTCKKELLVLYLSHPGDAGKEEVIAALVANVEAMIKADRKITALKQLQGHIWRTGFESNELEGVVFDDVPEALEKWHALGQKVYIYSSGSRLAQRLIFGNSNYGDLRKYLSGFFDTAVGNKRETRSYVEIAASLGVDKPSEILFVTDVYKEATAAKAAGLEVIISVRPGNGPLPENHGFKTVNSFSEI
ncbi:haloacid dehalogenase-like hydrolase family protein [Melia azedarach]|uniref:Haloacid dehalogenase-like hydrolase family protein n=1 Tax=Melia azedarach TaxID=155640 RepID=A0ACC1YUN7_MELAZ|nr:haloacid dehalogenase-like hydrolase family protein [Melia azedarach]